MAVPEQNTKRPKMRRRPKNEVEQYTQKVNNPTRCDKDNISPLKDARRTSQLFLHQPPISHKDTMSHWRKQDHKTTVTIHDGFHIEILLSHRVEKLHCCEIIKTFLSKKAVLWVSRNHLDRKNCVRKVFSLPRTRNIVTDTKIVAKSTNRYTGSLHWRGEVFTIFVGVFFLTKTQARATSPNGCNLKSGPDCSEKQQSAFLISIVTQSRPLAHFFLHSWHIPDNMGSGKSPIVAETQRISFLLAEAFKVSEIHSRMGKIRLKAMRRWCQKLKVGRTTHVQAHTPLNGLNKGKKCAKMWRRQRNVHILLRARGTGDSPVTRPKWACEHGLFKVATLAQQGRRQRST